MMHMEVGVGDRRVEVLALAGALAMEQGKPNRHRDATPVEMSPIAIVNCDGARSGSPI